MSASSPIAGIPMSWTQRALLIVLCRATTGKGASHRRALVRTLEALKGAHHWAYLEGASDLSEVVRPPSQAYAGDEPVGLSHYEIDFLLDEVEAKLEIKGTALELLDPVFEACHEVKKNRNGSP
jgi:hypothetical protein